MPNGNDVELNIGLKIGDVDFSNLSSNKLDKAVNNFVHEFQKTLDKASKTTVSRSIGALFGKDTTSDLIKNIQKSENTIKSLEDEYKSLSRAANSANAEMSAAMQTGSERAKRYADALKQLEEEESRLASDRKHAQIMYAANMSASKRAKDPSKRAVRANDAEYWKSEFERLTRAMSPEGQADRNTTKDFYRRMIASGGVSAKDMAEIAAKKYTATAGMTSTKEAISDESKDLKQKQRQLAIIEKFQRVGTIVSAIFGGDKRGGPSKAPKQFSKFGLKSTMSMNQGLKKLGKNFMMFGLGFRSVYYLIKSLRRMVIKDLAIMASRFSELDGPLSEVYMLINKLKGSVGTMIQPIISAVLPALKQLVQYLADAAEKVGVFFATLTGQEYIYRAKANQRDFAAAILGTEKSASYDELKVISDGQDIDYEKVAIEANNMSEIGQKFMEMFQKIGALVSGMFAQLSPIIGSLSPFITDMVSSLLPVVETLFTEIIVPALQLISPLLTLIVGLIRQLSPILTAVLQAVMPIITKLIEILLPILQRIFEALQPVFDAFVNIVLPFLVEVLDALMPLIEGILDCVVAILEPLLSLIAPLLDFVVLILKPVLAILKPILDLLGYLFSILGQILQPLLQLLTPLMEIINAVLRPVIELLTYIIEVIMGPLTMVIKFIYGIIETAVSGVLQIILGVINIITGAIKKVSNFITSIWTNIRKAFNDGLDVIKKVLNGIIGGMESMVNGVIRGINFLINALNKLSFDIPDWVPVLGGQKFGFSIPNIREVSIPKLAQGAVIPPNREFLASLGDQRHGTNVEAPLDTIKQALIDALTESGVMNRPITIQVDGRTLAQVVWDESDKRYRQTGKYAHTY